MFAACQLKLESKARVELFKKFDESFSNPRGVTDHLFTANLTVSLPVQCFEPFFAKKSSIYLNTEHRGEENLVSSFSPSKCQFKC